jgi:hypothetical protein
LAKQQVHTTHALYSLLSEKSLARFFRKGRGVGGAAEPYLFCINILAVSTALVKSITAGKTGKERRKTRNDRITGTSEKP